MSLETDLMEERMKEKWLLIFKEYYGDTVSIDEMECLTAGIKGFTYRVLVRNQEGEEGEHHLRLLLSGDIPVEIDGVLTRAGENYVDFWSGYGEAMAAALYAPPDEE